MNVLVTVLFSSGQIKEEDFVAGVLRLPKSTVDSMLQFHILPEEMKEKLHKNLLEVGYI